MKTFVPSYYRQFACIAGACRHSCCIGWEIDIDPESLGRYQRMGGELGERLHSNINREGETACFRLKGKEERCPFLNEDGLCDLILTQGEGILCQICTDHPRFRSFFTGRTEIGLGLCCEAAGRLILGWKEPIRLEIADDDGKEETPEPQERALLSLRERLFAVAQNRSLKVEERVEQLLAFAGASAEDFDWSEWADFLLSLERLDEAWTKALEQLRGAPACIPPLSQWQTEMEQLLVVLLYRHLPGALEDGDLRGHLLLLVLLWLIAAKLCDMQKADALDDLVEICRLCSSELEYSEENIREILDELNRRGLA